MNLIGDHTDYTGGLVCPMAIDLATRVRGHRGGHRVELRSSADDTPAVVPLDVDDPAALEPEWAKYVAGVVAEVQPATGFTGELTSEVPTGAGLSSSAALEVAVALALGARGDPVEVAMVCQRAEQRASGVPTGLMDQLTSLGGVEGHTLVIDCHELRIQPVPLPEEWRVLVAHSGQPRSLTASAYAERRAGCEAAEEHLGPLREATADEVRDLRDPAIRRLARHVVTENARVRAFAEALRSGDAAAAGELMAESHASLRHDFGVSTPALDALVDRLSGTPGVVGARLTGAGFGGCAVALVEAGAQVHLEGEHWWVRAAAGASVEAGERD